METEKKQKRGLGKFIGRLFAFLLVTLLSLALVLLGAVWVLAKSLPMNFPRPLFFFFSVSIQVSS